MAKPITTASSSYDADLAAVSLAGIRILKQTSVSPGATAESTYTITEQPTRRLVCIHNGSTNLDIRIELNATADATKIPVVPGVYFVVEAVKDDVVHFYNASAGAITVYLAEIR